MNNKDFTYLLQNPEAVTPAQTEGVKTIINQFPYFQSARAIYLKGLKNQESFQYNQELKTAAAYTTDRSILFDFITSDVFNQNEISQFIKINSEHVLDIDVTVEDISINKKIVIDNTSQEDIKSNLEVLDPSLFQPKFKRQKLVSFALDESENIEKVTPETKTQEASAEDILLLGKPLEFNKKETHSFNEWLKLASFKTIIRDKRPAKIESKTEDVEQLERRKKFKLIDEFITNNPKINPDRTYTPTHNIAKAQLIQPEELMTETLARIYVEQKNYKKAIQSYKILSLKYPEKSSFFAIQIRAVEQLQEQNNKE
jgi:ribosomal protein S18